MATKYEEYSTGYDYYEFVYDTYKAFQTFTPTSQHKVYSVKLYLWRMFSGTFNMKVGIYAVDENSQPTGSALCSKVLDVSSITDQSGSPEWKEFIFTTNPTLSKDIEYAIVAEEDSSAGSIRIAVCRDQSGASYARGQAGSGAFGTWSDYVGSDYYFEDWGTLSPPVDIVTVKKLVAFASNKAYYET